MSNEFFHTTKDGTDILLKDMGINHLRNTIAYIERRADKGVTVRSGGGFSWESDTMWYEEHVSHGDEALRSLNYQKYVDELERRKNLKSA